MLLPRRCAFGVAWPNTALHRKLASKSPSTERSSVLVSDCGWYGIVVASECGNRSSASAGAGAVVVNRHQGVGALRELGSVQTEPLASVAISAKLRTPVA